MAISTLSAISGVSTLLLPPVKSEHQLRGSLKDLPLHPKKKLAQTVGATCGIFKKSPLSLSHERRLNQTSGLRFASLICAAALNAKCSEGQTQTVEKPVSVISNAPVHSQEKTPQLDDGGTGFPPGDDGDGGGGGAGGGGNWSGGFFFFGFLAFLGFLKDKESESPYQDRRQELSAQN